MCISVTLIGQRADYSLQADKVQGYQAKGGVAWRSCY